MCFQILVGFKRARLSFGLEIGIFCDFLQYSVLRLSAILGLDFLGLALSRLQVHSSEGGGQTPALPVARSAAAVVGCERASERQAVSGTEGRSREEEKSRFLLYAMRMAAPSSSQACSAANALYSSVL